MGMNGIDPPQLPTIIRERQLPEWKRAGFKSEQAMKDFQNRTDFPGWDAL